MLVLLVLQATFNCENLFRRFEFKRNSSSSASQPSFTLEDTRFSINNDEEKSLTAAAILAVDADVLALQVCALGGGGGSTPADSCCR